MKKEIDYAISVPSSRRVMLLNHHINQEGEGEPEDKEEIIAENYEGNFGF